MLGLLRSGLTSTVVLLDVAFNWLFELIALYFCQLLPLLPPITTSTSTSNGKHLLLLLNDDLVYEVVLRLPAKSLMQFQIISKHWNSIITRDPIFAKAYKGGFRCLLITHLEPYREDTQPIMAVPRKFFYANYFDNNTNNNVQAYPHLSLSVFDLGVLGGPYYVTNKVNGLIGFYNRWMFGLCNITTHEFLKLPVCHDAQHTTYFLGFEPVEEVYKVLKFFMNEDSNYPMGDDVGIQICTFGRRGEGACDLDWRSLDPTPELAHVLVYMQSTCINGILYLFARKYYTRLKFEELLFSFDLTTETFSKIFQITDSTDTFECLILLVQLGGSPALIYFPTECGSMDIMWTMRSNDKTWSKSHTIDLMGITDLTSAGTLPTGEMLLAPKRAFANPLPIYKYDHIQNKLVNWIQVEGYANETDDNFVQISYHEENILTLASIIRSQRRRYLGLRREIMFENMEECEYI